MKQTILLESMRFSVYSYIVQSGLVEILSFSVMVCFIRFVYLSFQMKDCVKTMNTTLKNPSLPLLEMQVCLAFLNFLKGGLK